MKRHNYYVYIITNPTRTVLYIGVTSDLCGRLCEHKNKTFKGFSAEYNVWIPIYWEAFNSIQYAIAREKQLKGWSRKKKNKLISQFNPSWAELVVERDF